MLDAFLDTIFDVLKILPFLFLAFLLLECIEHKWSEKSGAFLKKAGKMGPLFGSLLGLLPQCGFGVVATNFYITHVISLGTLFAVYLATSDEMLPILFVHQAPLQTIFFFLLSKFLIGLFGGYLIDFIYRKRAREEIKDMCEHEHCDCSHSIIKSSFIHTLKTSFYLFVITFLLNLVFLYIEEDVLSSIVKKYTFFAPILCSLFGLIPNCGASIVLTDLYLNGILPFGACLSGLLSNSGISLLVLFKMNENKKENLIIVGLLFFIGALFGSIITALIYFI